MRSGRSTVAFDARSDVDMGAERGSLGRIHTPDAEGHPGSPIRGPTTDLGLGAIERIGVSTEVDDLTSCNHGGRPVSPMRLDRAHSNHNQGKNCDYPQHYLFHNNLNDHLAFVLIKFGEG